MRRNRFRPRPQKDHRGANQTECAYERDVLKPLLAAGEITKIRFQPVTFKYGEKPGDTAQSCKYTPDWEVTLPNGEKAYIENKREGRGQQAQKARSSVAIRACAAAYPEFHFTWAEGKVRKKTASTWTHKIIGGDWAPD